MSEATPGGHKIQQCVHGTVVVRCRCIGPHRIEIVACPKDCKGGPTGPNPVGPKTINVPKLAPQIGDLPSIPSYLPGIRKSTDPKCATCGAYLVIGDVVDPVASCAPCRRLGNLEARVKALEETLYSHGIYHD